MNQIETLAAQIIRTTGLVGPSPVPAGFTFYTACATPATLISDAALAGLSIDLTIAWSFDQGKTFPASVTMTLNLGSGGKAPCVGSGVPADPTLGYPTHYQVSYASRNGSLVPVALTYGLRETWS